MEKIVETGEDYKIVKRNSKYYYILSIPELSRDEKLLTKRNGDGSLKRCL